MKTANKLTPLQHYQLVEKAIEYIVKHHTQQPELAEVASYVGLSDYYFQRLFSQWVGVSPKRFLQFLSKEYIKCLLEKGFTNLDAGYQAGLSSGSRLHDLFISTEAISPSQYRSQGRNLIIYYDIFPSPFGNYLLAVTDKGICQLNFIQDNEPVVIEDFKTEWAMATLIQSNEATLSTHLQLFSPTKEQDGKLHVLLKGTNFQIQVWQALLALPFGLVCDYSFVANSINKPTAARATASAIAKNRIGYLIPCHRVVRKIGESGEYRWGSNRKKIMLATEASALQS